MKKNKTLTLLAIATLILVSLTGCFGPSDEEQVRNITKTHYEAINNGDTKLLFTGTNDIRDQLKAMSALVKCMVVKDKNVKNAILELDKKNKETSTKLTKLGEHIDSNETKKFDDDLESARGDKEKFQKVVLDFKTKHKENLDPQISKIMFEGAILNAETPQEYLQGMMFNIGLETMINPLKTQFPEIGKTCVQEITNNIPMTSISRITLSDDKSTATVEVLLENNTTTSLELIKVDKDWKIK